MVLESEIREDVFRGVVKASEENDFVTIFKLLIELQQGTKEIQAKELAKVFNIKCREG